MKLVILAENGKIFNTGVSLPDLDMNHPKSAAKVIEQIQDATERAEDDGRPDSTVAQELDRLEEEEIEEEDEEDENEDEDEEEEDEDEDEEDYGSGDDDDDDMAGDEDDE